VERWEETLTLFATIVRLVLFLGMIGHSTRSKWAPLYVRGLSGSDGPLWRMLAEQADNLLSAMVRCW
jgi:hypothetical protein